MHARTRTHGCNRLRARMLQVQQAQTSPAQLYLQSLVPLCTFLF